MDYSFVAESKHAWRVKTKRKAFVATEIYCHSGCLTVGKCVCGCVGWIPMLVGVVGRRSRLARAVLSSVHQVRTVHNKYAP
jgi:hypothetical protein